MKYFILVISKTSESYLNWVIPGEFDDDHPVKCRLGDIDVLVLHVDGRAPGTSLILTQCPHSVPVLRHELNVRE